LIPFGLHVFLRALILPPACLLIVGVAGLVCWRRWPRVGFALCAVCVGGLWVLSTPFIADALARSVERYPALDPSRLTPDQARAQAIVILAGGVRRDAPEEGGDAPSALTAFRLVEGAKVARATHLPILISGNVHEAPAMRRFLEEDMQVPVRWIESTSKDTRENADFSARILLPAGVKRIILVTSSAHMARSVADFADAGFEVIAAPAQMWTLDERGALAVAPSISALFRSHIALYEWIGGIVR
jgi:uncharacterized SAM-binding protein YcdF (DUF218 family)